jgi:hypothetical protein
MHLVNIKFAESPLPFSIRNIEGLNQVFSGVSIAWKSNLATHRTDAGLLGVEPPGPRGLSVVCCRPIFGG